MKTVKEIAILLGLSIVAALAVNYFSPSGIALMGQWDTAQGVVTAKEKNGTVDLARKMYDSGDYIFVDARSTEDYDEGHANP